MRRQDRLLQIQELRPVAAKLSEIIQQYVHSLSQKIKPPFSVSLSGIGLNLALPNGIDVVGDLGAAVVVGLETRPHTRIAHLRLGSKGDRCVIFRARWVNRSGPQRSMPQAWEELAWFDPARLPKEGQIAEWINELIVMAMEEFETEPPGLG